MSIHDPKPLRTRTTWKARSAAMNDPPANPGYEPELQREHPAAYSQPTEADLAKGDPSAWAEDPTPPPYKEGNPPANPGYDEFDRDHPAIYSKTREPMTASARQRRIAAEKQRIKKLAVRCTRAARSFLGSQASEDDVAHLGTVLMSDPTRLARIEQAPGAPAPAATSQKATSQQACGDGVMGDDMMMDEPIDDVMDTAPLGPPADDADLGSFDDGDDDLDDLDDDTLDDGGVFGSDAMNKQMMSALKDIQSAVKTQGQRLAMIEDRLVPASAKSAATKEAAQRALTASSAKSLFAALDGNRDGKILASEWKGSRGLFAALDRNDDGVISAEDLYRGLGVPAPTASAPSLKPQDATLAARLAEESEGEKEEMGEDGGSDDSGKSASDDSDLPPFIKDKKEEDEANKEASRAATAAKRPAPSKAATKPTKKKAAEEDDDKAGDDDEQTSEMPTASTKPAVASRKPAPKAKQAAEGDEDDKDESTDAQAASILADDDAETTDEDDDAEPMASAAFFDDGVAPMSAADQAVLDDVFGGGQTAGNLPLNPQPRRASAGAKALGAAGMSRQASVAKPAVAGRRRTPEDMSPDELSALWG